jgi:hypothetical protein
MSVKGERSTDRIDDILRKEENDAGEQRADGRAPAIELLNLSGSKTVIVSLQPQGEAAEVDVKRFEIFGVAEDVVDNGRVSHIHVISGRRRSLGVSVDAAGGLDNLSRAIQRLGLKGSRWASGEGGANFMREQQWEIHDRQFRLTWVKQTGKKNCSGLKINWKRKTEWVEKELEDLGKEAP